MSRQERLAQMTKQEAIIAKKRREIVEKQKNQELAKAIAANMTSKSNQETTEEIEQVSVVPVAQSSSFRNAFNNDGSFLEKFKKVTETTKLDIEKKTDENKLEEIIYDEESDSAKKDRESPEETIKNPIEYLDSDTNISNPCSSQSLLPFPSLLLPQPIVNISVPSSVPIISSVSSIFFNPTIPPPITQLTTTTDPKLYTLTGLQGLQNIPAPKPISLNEIPAPKAFDLNAIPKPELNLDAIMIPEFTTINKVFSDNDNIPTTLEQLVDMVAEKGDDYEDKLRLRKNDVHSSLWFLYAKDSEAYCNYRQLIINARRKKRTENNTKYDPAEIYIEKDDDLCNDSDSDYEYMKEAKERNLTNMKLRLTNRRDEYYSSDSDEEEEERFEKRYHARDDYLDKETESSDSKSSKKIKKSRWGDKVECDTFELPHFYQTPTIVNDKPQLQQQQLPQPQPPIYKQTRTDLALLQYARQNFGTIDLSEEDWKKAEEHYKINLLYQDMLKKRQEIDRLAKNGKFKYEYDSDEDTTGGTWEHKLRSAEMEATQVWAEALNKHSEGKHHIGDFLPPEELKKFMEQYNAKKNNREPDLSDYKEYKLKEDNIGFKMLQKLGWKEGQGLGAGGSGIVDPINKAVQRECNQGLGASSVNDPNDNDNEYEAYRKRMMLAYRFRPNPLNNPRRAYY